MQRWKCSRTCFKALWTVCLAVGLAAVAAPAGAQISATACNDPGSCDDGLYCNGEETCSANGCVNGVNPCPGRACDEGLDICLPGQNPRLEGGWVGVGGTLETVLLTNTYERPVVVTGLHYRPTDPPMVVRIRQTTSDSFELYLQNPSGDPVPQRRVSYLVVEEGAWEVEGLKLEARRFPSTLTDPEGQLAGESFTFLQTYQEPVVVGQVMSARDEDWSVFWAGGGNRRWAPAWNALLAGKTSGADPDTDREEEILGFVVFEAGRHRLGAAELEAGVTSQSVVGMGNGSRPYIQPFQEPFDQIPEVAIASVAGLFRADAGWAVMPSVGRAEFPAVATKSGLPLAIDEDQIGDAERSHGTEKVAYVVFDEPFSYQKTPLAIPGITYPGGSDYYSCRLDQNVWDSRCSAVNTTLENLISTCEQTVDDCTGLLNLSGTCGSCLSPIPNWKKNPIVAFIFCVPACGQKLLDFAACRYFAQGDLRSAADTAICTTCGGTDCGLRYGVEVEATGLSCDERLFADIKCSSDATGGVFQVDHLAPSQTFPDWCPWPDQWEVNVSQVFDTVEGGYIPKRDCTPTRRSGPPIIDGYVQANFDCSCSGAGCGNDDSYPLVADVSCMPVNSWFRLKTTVTDTCGGNVREETVRVNYPSPSGGRFPIGLDARPGESITAVVIEDSPGATCYNEGPFDTTMPADPPGGEFSVTRVRCDDDVGAGGCGSVELKGVVGGEGFAVRPNGVTVRVTLDGSPQTKNALSSPFFFNSPGQPGQSYVTSVVDPIYSFGDGHTMVSSCHPQGASSGTLPPSDVFQVADISCTLLEIQPPIEPDHRPEPDPFDWDLDEPCFDLQYVCEPNPEPTGGEPEPCDPCTYCRNQATGECPDDCFCDNSDVPGGRCRWVCADSSFSSSPALSVTAGARPSTSSQLKADDVLTVSGSAFDPDGLQGFMVAVDGIYEDHVFASGSNGSFSALEIDTSSLPEGEHTLRVIALDAHAQSPIPGFVDIPFQVDHSTDPCAGDSIPPGLSITVPASGAILTPGTVHIQASAADAGSGVKQVKFWANGQDLGLDTTSPYGRPWTATPGSYTLKALAWDHCNNVRSKEIPVTVIDPCAGQPAPTVAITNVQDGDWVDPALYHFEASAQDFSGTGIDRVEFEVASFSNTAIDETAPYVSTGWWLLSEQDETITAQAYDGCGRVATDVVTIHVNENASVCSVDQNHPWAQVAVPTEGSVLPAGPVFVRADAADDGLLFASALEVDGAIVPNSTIPSHDPSNYQWTWDATQGTHVLRIRVMDVCGKIGFSLPRTVTVQ